MKLKKLYRALDYLIERFKQMNVLDIGIFKTCLISLGILLGTYAHRTFRKFAPLVWIVFLGSYLVLIYRLLISPLTESRH